MYDDQQQKTWYKNLNAIKNKSLSEIQAEEREHHEKYGDKATNWNKTYHFEYHRLAQSVLLALGFTGVDDTTIKTKAKIEAAIQEHRAEWIAQYDHVVAALQLRTKTPKFSDVYFSLRYLSDSSPSIWYRN